MAIEGTGTTITFATSAFTAEVIDIQHPELSRESLETTHLGTTTAKTFQPSKLHDPGECSITVHHDPADEASDLIGEDPEVITITYPLESGQSTAATKVFTGFVTSVGGESMKVGELMQTKLTIKITGPVVPYEGS
jgi:hypothetical protein